MRIVQERRRFVGEREKQIEMTRENTRERECETERKVRGENVPVAAGLGSQCFHSADAFKLSLISARMNGVEELVSAGRIAFENESELNREECGLVCGSRWSRIVFPESTSLSPCRSWLRG